MSQPSDNRQHILKSYFERRWLKAVQAGETIDDEDVFMYLFLTAVENRLPQTEEEEEP
jgi:hypothetical protein